MPGLLDLVLRAHGGEVRWRQTATLRAEVSVCGSSWPSDGVLADTVATVDTRAQRTAWDPFGKAGQRALYTPERVQIYGPDGSVVAERSNPRASFQGFTHRTPWDPLHKLYFSGYAFWNYINSPFLLARDEVEFHEIEPWRENGETWRRLAVHFPSGITTHNDEQTFYFGERDFLLRRHDYASDVLGGFPTAHYVGDHRTFDGFVFPTRRWVVPRLPDGFTLEGPVVVSLDIRSISVS
ncbi:hypothetical protein GTZ78_10735 [Streptomyces sp. SID8361]|uniref:hypothetical protein n=1 Tax=Streptomyces sp. MnatMP-M27 TaxID=1839768 RepID=UPI00081E0EAF|nr:hypothetical protein [Streptomyces sp. MnatMP-M27]MYU11154.1 hypothetical protein [Streptomyces sp. SID8361]SCF78752.1 hypothetical protein GA0115260_1024628 [Streptomyces sp. MnatMP-M27]